MIIWNAACMFYFSVLGRLTETKNKSVSMHLSIRFYITTWKVVIIITQHLNSNFRFSKHSDSLIFIRLPRKLMAYTTVNGVCSSKSLMLIL